MKKRYITTALLALGLVAGCVEMKEESEDHESKAKHEEREDKEDREESKHEDSEKGEKESRESKAKLQALARINEKEARQIALAKVPGGKIKEGELERENGHLQWSFDMAIPGERDITEVNVDAITGEILSVAKEAAETEKAEENSEKNEKEKD